MRVYISGRIKDYPDFREHFAAAARRLTNDLCYEVIDPCEVDPGCEEPTYEDYMKADLRELLHCNAIYMLRGWERSVGARTEHLVAAMCGLEIMYEPAGDHVYATA